MALYTDGFPATVSMLRSYDSALMSVASTERIDIADKQRLAQRELGLEIDAFLLRQGVPTGSGGGPDNVVVTDQLSHVHALLTMAMLYRDAYNSQLNDRYKGKWQEYAKEAEAARRRLFETGIGISLAPVPRPGAPVLGSITGGSLPRRTYAVSVQWIGTSGLAGSTSEPVLVEVPAGKLLTVAAPFSPEGVTKYVVIAGQSESAMFRQSAGPVPAIEMWREAFTGLRRDLPPWPEQRADYWVANRRQMLRG